MSRWVLYHFGFESVSFALLTSIAFFPIALFFKLHLFLYVYMCVREGTCTMGLVELVLLFYHVDPSWQQASLPAVPTEPS